MSCKKLYRFETRYFKPNQKIYCDKGFFVYRLNKNKQYSVDFYQSNDEQIYKKNVNQRYDYIDQYIKEKDSQVMIIQYFQINEEKGIQADLVYQLTKIQLNKYINNEIEKINKENVTYFKN